MFFFCEISEIVFSLNVSSLEFLVFDFFFLLHKVIYTHYLLYR